MGEARPGEECKYQAGLLCLLEGKVTGGATFRGKMISRHTGIAANFSVGAKKLWRTMEMPRFYKFLIASHLDEGVVPVMK